MLNNNKKFRFDLFVHLDGIALTAPLSCLFKNNYKKISELKSRNEIEININDLSDYNINGDYLNVTLRLFESQGWIKREWINKEKITIKTTNYGKCIQEVRL